MYQLDNLKRFPGLVHGFSEIKEGNMSFDWGDADSVIENRKTFLAGLGIRPADCVITRTRMSHGTEIETIDSQLKGRGTEPPISDRPDVDAVMTNEMNLFLGILTADCLPVIIHDPVKNAVALVHLSRINTPNDFILSVTDKMKTEYGSEPKNLIVGIGPCVRKESYVFPAGELKELVPDEKIFKGFIISLPDGKKALDLVGYNVEELISAGVPRKNIGKSDADTAVDRGFFSHSRSRITGEPEGRMMTIVGIGG